MDHLAPWLEGRLNLLLHKRNADEHCKQCPPEIFWYSSQYNTMSCNWMILEQQWGSLIYQYLVRTSELTCKKDYYKGGNKLNEGWKVGE